MGKYIYLPTRCELKPGIVSLDLSDSLKPAYKLLQCDMVQPIRMQWPRSIGLLGDEEARYNEEHNKLNPWLKGNGRVYDVVGPLIICRTTTLGGLTDAEIDWCMKNVVDPKCSSGGPGGPGGFRITSFDDE
jgi:hypothetical protein